MYEERRRMVEVAHRAYWLRLTPGTSGNLSVRKAGYLLMTPTGSALGALSPEDIVEIPGKGRPSSEIRLHKALFCRAKGVRAILHFHGTWSILAAESHRFWRPAISLPELEGLTRTGCLPVVEPAPPGSQKLADRAALHYSPDAQGLLLKRHGAVTWGTTPEEALYMAETLEAAAHLDYWYRERGENRADSNTVGG